MKLIHCGDFHLDSPLNAFLPPEKSKQRKEELLGCFRRLAEEALRVEAAALLIAGDLFDNDHPTKKSKNYVLDVIRSHPSVSFYYLAGNHESCHVFDGAESLPENLFLFDSTWKTYFLPEGVTLSGSESPEPDTLAPLPRDSCNLILLHGQTEKGTGKEEDGVLHLAKYREKNLDYFALGHIHSYGEESVDRRGVACYCGCPEGRGFDEIGDKGYVLLDWDGKTLSHRFIPFSKRRIHLCSCDVTECDSPAELERRADAAVAEIPGEDLVKLLLVGACPWDAMPDISRLQEFLGDRFFFLKVKSDCRARWNARDFETDVSLKGEFVRTVLADKKLSPEEKERIIFCGLQALTGEEILL